jgi:hypothetical protein
MTQVVDEARLGEFMGQMVGYMTGGAMCFGVWLPYSCWCPTTRM